MQDKLLVRDHREKLAQAGDGLDDSGRHGAEEFEGRSCQGVVCEAVEDLPSENLRNHVRINVHVHSVTVERNPGFFDRVFSQPAERLTLDQFAVEISEQAPVCDIVSLMHSIATLRETQPYRSRAMDDSTGRRPAAHSREDVQPSESGAVESGSLNIWV